MHLKTILNLIGYYTMGTKYFQRRIQISMQSLRDTGTGKPLCFLISDFLYDTT